MSRKTGNPKKSTKPQYPVQDRPMGSEAKSTSGQTKRILNLNEESQHNIGPDKLKLDIAAREADEDGK